MNPSFDDSVALDRLRKLSDGVRQQLGRVVVGQSEAIDLIFIGLLANGHCLLIGVPGLAKTLIVRTFANVLDASFARIQFTPDLMPSDVTGTDVLVQNQDTGDRSFRFLRGPIFANILLADEINRAPPKTQSALLEAMQERQVTIGAERHWLPDPFFVLATQNPIEHEGTYPLPEAQLDRFMFVVNLDYPLESEELRMLLQTTSDEKPEVEALMHATDILEFRHLVRRIAISESLAAIALRLVRLTRPTQDNPIKEVRDNVAFGAGPRAGQFLILAAKCSAALRGSPLVLEEDVFRFVAPIMLHRMKTNFSAQAKGLGERDLIEIVVEFVQNELKNKAERSGAGKLLRS